MKIKIEKLVHGGHGMGHAESGLPVFVPKSLPDETLEIEIFRKHKKFSFAAIKNIIKKSSDRISPDCSHFNLCGGCDFRHINRNKELEIKQQILLESLHFAKIKTDIKPIISASPETEYRNTSRFFFKKDQENTALCMTNFDYKKGLLPVNSCLHQSKIANKIINITKLVYEATPEKDLPWQIRIREGKQTKEILVELITKEKFLAKKDEIIQNFRSIPEIKSIYHTITKDKNLRSVERKLLFGSPIIFEKIGPYRFQISPDSFFQTNSLGVKNLYDQIKIAARGDTFGQNIIDLFCGAGTIGIYLSNFAKEIIGLDITPSAIKDARENAKINKVKNARFEIADLERDNLQKIFQKLNLNKQFVENSAIILDPPRDGLSKKLIEQITKLDPKNIVMVSCNPSTMIRDLKIFAEFNLNPQYIQPVDMFPRTHHLETITKLIKVK